MTVVVTGDFEPSVAEAWVKKYFGSMEKKANPPRPAIGTPVDLGPGEKIIPNPESAKSSIMLTVVKPLGGTPRHHRAAHQGPAPAAGLQHAQPALQRAGQEERQPL